LHGGKAVVQEYSTEEYSAAGSEPVEGKARSLEEVTAEELLMSFPPDPARPEWMLTRFPVMPEEYQRLNEAAAEPETGAAAAEAALTDATTEDDDTEEELRAMEAPEGETVAEMAPVEAAPNLIASFQGIPQTAFRPPDNTVAVGPNDVMVAVNTDLAVYTKSGVLRFRWANMTTLFSPVLPSGATIFDPRVAYDHYERRWIVIAAARRASPPGSWLMLGVSQGADPGGAYWVWALNATLNGSSPTNNWADYPMLGFDTQGIYISSNMFQFGGGFQYTKLRILNKAEVYAGGTGTNHFIRWYDYWDLRNPDSSMAFTVQPAVHFRGTGGNPPAYLINALWPGGDSLTLWTLSNPVGYWIGGTSSLSRASVSCRRYDLPPDASQRDSGVRIETNDARLLSAIYQFVGGIHRIWTCHTSRHTWSGESEARSVVQWYEIDVPSRNVVQQNRYGASGRYYYFPAIQTDISRNAYIVFGRSGSTEYAQLRRTGRRVISPPNDLDNSAIIKSGESSYTGLRWGDYFGICRDGGNSSIVWMYGEYARAGNTWGSWVGETRY
jgi:hypothetical protein